MIYVFIFILGICLGSFANVLIDRTQAKKSIRGRSICDFCNYVLSWLDNIPIISFLILKCLGRAAEGSGFFIEIVNNFR